ncbi:MAG: DUF1570 domain-containing protein [Phycisphaerales bacterium]
MWNSIIRFVAVAGVLCFAALAMGVRPSPAGTPSANAIGEDDRGLVRIVEPLDAEASAKLAVEQLQALGSRSTLTRAEPFLIVSDAEAAWTQNRAALLQRASHQFKRFADRLGFRLEPSEQPLVVVLVNDHDRYAEFARRHDAVDAGWVAGYYASLSNRVVFYNDETGPMAAQAGERLREFDDLVSRAKDMASDARRERRPEVAATLEKRAAEMAAKVKHERHRVTSATRVNGQAKAVHEAVHLLAFNWGLQARDREYPFWLTEGLATNFETEKPGNAFGPEHEFEPRRRDFERLRQDGRLLPVEVLVQLMAVPGDDEEMADVMYAQSWSLFRYLFRYERASLCEYFRDILGQPAGRMGPKRHLELFRARFGDVDALERAWLKRA